ncbi:MAG: hypothetical protein VB093_04085, partial [Propionicimonas sp.]|nr:hypothetical protein [Propionicimonas sp.]
AVLFAGLLAVWDWLDLLPTLLEFQVYRLTFSILNSAGISPEDRTLLLDRPVVADQGRRAPAFARAVVTALASEDVDGPTIWETWLRDHLRRRLDGIPRTPDPAELARWADIVPSLGRYTQEAIEMLRGHGIGLGEGFRSLDWDADLLASSGEVVVAHVADRVSNSLPQNPISSYRVSQMLENLTAALGPAACKPVLDAAIEAGFTTTEIADDGPSR